MRKREAYVLCIVGMIFLYGFFLRVYALGDQSIWIDESFSINAALEILEKGYPLLDSGYLYTHGLLHSYLLAVPLFFGVNTFNARIISVLFGSLMIVLGYFLGKEFHSRTAGFLMSFFLSFSYWQIAWSRQARMYIVLAFFFWLSILYFYRWTCTYKRKDFLICIGSTLCTIFSHSLGYSLFLIYFLYYGGLLLVDRKRFSHVIMYFKKNRYVFSSFILATVIIGYKIFSLITKHFFNQNKNYYELYSWFLKTEYLLFVLLSLFGIVFVIKNFKASYLLLLCFIPTFLTLVFVYNLLHLRYLFFITPVLLLFSAMYLAQLSTTYIGTFVGLVVLLLIIFFQGMVFIPQHNYTLEIYTPQPHFKEAYDWIKNNIPNYENQQYTVSETAVHRFYTGLKPTYWVRFSFTGIKRGMEWKENATRERYTNALIVKDTVPGTIGIYDGWSIQKKGFSANVQNATRIKDIFIVDRRGVT